jgi:hypothetical protein
MLVFIDDSGDPGFQIKKGSSSVFVITLVIFDDNLEAEKTSVAIKELRRKLKISDNYEFKFNKSNDRFKKAFFECVTPFKYSVRAIVVRKELIYSPRLRAYKENFYNYVIMQVLKQSKGYVKHAKLKFDKRGERAIRDQLRVYLSRELDNKKHKIFSDVKFVDSKQNTLIQLADMIAGSIFAAYSRNRKLYLNQLQKARRIEDIWSFK